VGLRPVHPQGRGEEIVADALVKQGFAQKTTEEDLYIDKERVSKELDLEKLIRNFPELDSLLNR